MGCAWVTLMAARHFPARPFVWLVHVALPLLGLWVLTRRPQVDHDLMWQHQGPHFWLVLVTALDQLRARDQGRAGSAPPRRRAFVPRRTVVPHRRRLPRAARARHAHGAHRRVELRLRARCADRSHPRGDPRGCVRVPARAAPSGRRAQRAAVARRRVRLVRGVGRVVARAVAPARRTADVSSSTAPTSPRSWCRPRCCTAARRSSTSCST